MKGLVSATIAVTLLGNGCAFAHAVAAVSKRESGADAALYTVAQRFAVNGAASKKLIAIDGSALILTAGRAGLTREIIAPDGSTERTVFSFRDDKTGSVFESGHRDRARGAFHLTDNGIVSRFRDGHSEDFFPNSAGGVSLKLSAPGGQTYCMAWYPHGHRFSRDERKASLAAYASGRDERKRTARTSCIQIADAHAPSREFSRRGRSGPSVLAPSVPHDFRQSNARRTAA